MSDFVRINTGRVEKIMEILTLIEKSARSQRPGDAEVLQLLAPLRARIGLAPVAAPPHEDGRPQTTSRDPRRFPAMVNQLSAAEFHALVCAIAIRCQDELAECRGPME